MTVGGGDGNLRRRRRHLLRGAAHAATPAQKCQAGKNKVAGKYAACRHGAEAKLATTGDGTAYTAAIGKCATKYSAAWQKLETNAGGACPSNGDATAIGAVVTDTTTNIATAVGGGPLADCPADLATCAAEPRGQRTKTGQTACFDAGGTVIPCAGTGQDGELQKGLARSYTHNGDGTITDDRTGLMWEKLSDDGGIHNKDTTYNWTNAFAVKVATLNSGGGFAGHTDWRVPNVNELQSLVSYGAVAPAVDVAFNNGCTGGCTVRRAVVPSRATTGRLRRTRTVRPTRGSWTSSTASWARAIGATTTTFVPCAAARDRSFDHLMS